MRNEDLCAWIRERESVVVDIDPDGQFRVSWEGKWTVGESLALAFTRGMDRWPLEGKKLAQCAFCGSMPRTINFDAWQVACQNPGCLCRGPGARTEDIAIKHWNERGGR